MPEPAVAVATLVTMIGCSAAAVYYKKYPNCKRCEKPHIQHEFGKLCPDKRGIYIR